jgi:hypothetical protein
MEEEVSDNKRRDELAEHLDKIPLGLQSVMGYSVSKAFRDGWNARDEEIADLKAQVASLSKYEEHVVDVQDKDWQIKVRCRGLDYIAAEHKHTGDKNAERDSSIHR